MEIGSKQPHTSSLPRYHSRAGYGAQRGRRKVFVGLSGGVDSSVAAALLQKEGHRVHGVYLKVWSPDLEDLLRGCPWEEDVRYASAVADHLQIPFAVWDVSKEYYDNVVSYFFSEYEAGRTPNPDIMCNREIKFGIFLERARASGADAIATGHYVRIKRDPKNPNTSELSEVSKSLTELAHPNHKIVEKELSYQLNGVFFEVQKELGRFCRERQYADAIEKKFRERGIRYRREYFHEVAGRKSNVADFIVEDKVIIELKTIPFITKEDYYQLARYLESLHLELGLLVNFRQEYLKPKRVLNTKIYKEKFGTFGLHSEHSDRYTLLQAKDLNKDQSYFLYSLTQDQLRYALFPIGEYTKPEVRAMALEWGLPTANRKDSQGLCFLGKIPVREFLKTRLARREGALVTTSGEAVGTHEGAHYCTIGQRHGIGSRGGGTPYFVVEKDIAANRVIVAMGRQDAALYRKEARLEHVHWIAGIAPELPLACLARIRYRQPLQEAKLMIHDSGFMIHFLNPQRAVTPGQACVFYDEVSFDGVEDKHMLGGGVIA